MTTTATFEAGRGSSVSHRDRCSATVFGSGSGRGSTASDSRASSWSLRVSGVAAVARGTTTRRRSRGDRGVRARHRAMVLRRAGSALRRVLVLDAAGRRARSDPRTDDARHWLSHRCPADRAGRHRVERRFRGTPRWLRAAALGHASGATDHRDGLERDSHPESTCWSRRKPISAGMPRCRARAALEPSFATRLRSAAASCRRRDRARESPSASSALTRHEQQRITRRDRSVAVGADGGRVRRVGLAARKDPAGALRVAFAPRTDAGQRRARGARPTRIPVRRSSPDPAGDLGHARDRAARGSPAPRTPARAARDRRSVHRRVTRAARAALGRRRSVRSVSGQPVGHVRVRRRVAGVRDEVVQDHPQLWRVAAAAQSVLRQRARPARAAPSRRRALRDVHARRTGPGVSLVLRLSRVLHGAARARRAVRRA